MVGSIFYLAKLNTVPWMFTAALSLSDSEYMASLAYIEGVTDATNDTKQTDNKCDKMQTITSTIFQLLYPVAL